MFGSVRAAQPLSTPVPSELSAILEAPVRNVLIHINGPSNSSASHVRFGSGTDMTASTYDVRSYPPKADIAERDCHFCFGPLTDTGGSNVITVAMTSGRYLYGVRRRRV